MYPWRAISKTVFLLAKRVVILDKVHHLKAHQTDMKILLKLTQGNRNQIENTIIKLYMEKAFTVYARV